MEAGGAFTPDEQAALVTALGIDGISLEGWALRTIVPLAPETGTIGEYSVLASQALVTLRLETFSTTFGFSHLDGWTGLDAGLGTVASAISVEAVFRDSFPSSVTATVDPDQTVDGEMRAYYHDASFTFIANSGEFALRASGFGSFEDCPDFPSFNPTSMSKAADTPSAPWPARSDSMPDRRSHSRPPHSSCRRCASRSISCSMIPSSRIRPLTSSDADRMRNVRS